MDRIFDSFFSTKQPGQGTGLGLSTILEAMHQCQGGVTVTSKKNAGTEFSLFFPKSMEHHALQQVQAPVSPVSRTDTKLTILLVEDEDAVRLFAARALREQGHHVIEMRDGVQALDHVNGNHPIHLLITDVMMPGIDGPTLADRLHKMMSDMRILFVSGYPQDEVRKSLSTTLKSVHFLPKPFALKDLVSQVDTIACQARPAVA
jgi:two-component system cell cycle sensor histidine kinase/response regulator CckA